MFYVGQRWYSEAEPELGLGIITQKEAKLVQVFFSNSELLRTYNIQNPPLKRFKLDIGDEAIGNDDTAAVITKISEIDNIITYFSNDIAIPEANLKSQIDLSGPLERLIIQNFDSPKFFDIRYKSYLAFRNYQQFRLKGFLGAKINLIPHQIYISNEVLQLDRPRIMLCDEVGLGKTIEASLIIHSLIQREIVSNILIVVPDSLVHQWFIELYKKFSLTFKTVNEDNIDEIDLDSGQRYIISSSLFNADSEVSDLIGNHQWDMLVLDEAHQISFQQEDNFKANFLREISKKSYSTLFLSATPEVMGIKNLFAQLNTIEPARYNNFENFLEENNKFNELSDDIRNLQETSIREFNLEKYFSSDEIPSLTTKEGIVNKLVDRFGSGRSYFRNSRSNLEKTQNLFTKRKLQEHPIEKPTIINDKVVFTEKANIVFKILSQQGPTKKILVICHSREIVKELTKNILERENIKIAQFHSGQSLLERDRQAVYFSDPEGARLMVCTEVGSEGRNFEFSHHLILFDIPKLPDQLEQRIGRLDRIGQKSDVNIHLPYIKNSFEEVLFRWYNEVLGAFHSFPKGANLFYQNNKERLITLIESPNLNLLDSEIQDLSQKYNVFQKELEEGRDFLIEKRSFNNLIALEKIDAIHDFEQKNKCQPFIEDLFNEIGVDIEQLNPLTYFIKPSHNMLIPSFPGLMADGISITYDRKHANLHENIDYLNWEHPIIKAAFELLLSSTLGNLSMVQTEDLPRNIYFEFIIVLQCQDKMRYLTAQYLPYTPLRSLLDVAKNELTNKISKKMVDQCELTKITPDQAEQFKEFPKSQIVELCKEAYRTVDPRVEKLKTKALQAISADISEESNRILKLQIPQAEKDRLTQEMNNRQLLLNQAIKNAKPQLDSIRVILPKN